MVFIKKPTIMKKTRLSFYLVSFALISLLTMSCQKDENPYSSSDINDYILTMPLIEFQPEMEP